MSLDSNHIKIIFCRMTGVIIIIIIIIITIIIFIEITFSYTSMVFKKDVKRSKSKVHTINDKIKC